MQRAKITPKNEINITFNTLSGWLGLKAIDGISNQDFIRFDFKENFAYNWQKNIKESSRHFSLIDIHIPLNKKKSFVSKNGKK